MHVDRGSFLMLVTTLAAGGGLGYLASEKNVVPHLDDARNKPPPAPPPVVPEPPKPNLDHVDAAPAAPPPPPPAPVCDDSGGTPGACPPPGFPTIEGGCGSFAANRCAEFKQALKPRVAQWAVECLAKLTPAERCDEKRVNLCGHLAIMNACPDQSPDAGDTPMTSQCLAIIGSCGPSVVAPSLAECRQVMNALNEVGRDRMVQCMKKHCFDRGLLYCEASAKP